MSPPLQKFALVSPDEDREDREGTAETTGTAGTPTLGSGSKRLA